MSDQSRTRTTMMNRQVLLRFMAQDSEASPLRSSTSPIADLVTSSLVSAERRVSVFSLTLMTWPIIPLEVTTLSPALTPWSSFACSFARFCCGES